jgi:hypothetical protein
VRSAGAALGGGSAGPASPLVRSGISNAMLRTPT